jgi:hypothetical protein
MLTSQQQLIRVRRLGTNLRTLFDEWATDTADELMRMSIDSPFGLDLGPTQPTKVTTMPT